MLSNRILVTGGHGFVGTHVVATLRARFGAQAITAPLRSAYDLRKEADVRTMLETHRPRAVIHLAATVGGIGANKEYPADFFYDNAMMGMLLMHEASRAHVQKFVNVATVCAYPKHAALPLREEDLWNGYPEGTNAPYGIAKRMLITQAAAYREQYGFNAITLIPTNMYGPGDSFDPSRSHVIPAITRKCIEAIEHRTGRIVLWGDGSATRDFLYVEDAAEAIVSALETYDDALPLNIGTGTETSIRDLAALIAQLTGFTGEIAWDAGMPAGQPRRMLDISRAARMLSFSPRHTLREGLAKTIEQYAACVACVC